MKVVGSALLGVERARVWAALQDPGVLVQTIPGCERLESVGADTYKMTVSAGVASIKGIYQGEVALAEPQEPERFVLRARGQGAPGTVEATVQVRLSEIDGGTRVDYDAEAVVGGMIGGVGQRMLGSVAKKTAGEFFSAVENHLLSGTPVLSAQGVSAQGVSAPVVSVPVVSVPAMREPTGAGAVPETLAAAPPVAEAGQVFSRTPEAAGRRPPRQGVPPWSLLAAFGMGAGIALGSAVIGWLLGRQRS